MTSPIRTPLHSISIPLWSLLLVLLGGCTDSHHEPHGHEHTTRELPTQAVTLWTETSELFMEHPTLIVGAPAKFLVHLTVLSDFAPLRSGSVSFHFSHANGEQEFRVVQEAPRAPGIYGPTAEFPSAGTWNLNIEIDSPQLQAEIPVSGLRVFRSADQVPYEEETANGGVTFLKEQQWKTKNFRTTFAEKGALSHRFEATGEIIPASGHYAGVSAPIAGVVKGEESAVPLVPGKKVSKGQVLATLIPSLGEAGSSVAAARRELREAEAEDARARRLFDVGAIPERRLREAKIRLDAARESVAALVGNGVLSPDGEVSVRAPITGVVTELNISPGAQVEAGAKLLTLIDPSTVWLKVNVPITSAPLIEEGAEAHLQVEGLPQTFELERALSVGAVLDPRSRTVPVLYEVDNREGVIKIGMHARASIRTSQRTEGVLIPRSALLDVDGQSVAYVQSEGESFEKRRLELGSRDGERVLVLAGIEPGERVVTGDIYQVHLASLSTSVPAHGHGH